MFTNSHLAPVFLELSSRIVNIASVSQGLPPSNRTDKALDVVRWDGLRARDLFEKEVDC